MSSLTPMIRSRSAPGRFDRLTFKQTEPSAVTDANGQFEIKGLFPGLYDVSVLSERAVRGFDRGCAQTNLVTRYENYLFNDTLRPNVPPEVEQRFLHD